MPFSANCGSVVVPTDPSTLQILACTAGPEHRPHWGLLIFPRCPSEPPHPLLSRVASLSQLSDTHHLEQRHSIQDLSYEHPGLPMNQLWFDPCPPHHTWRFQQSRLSPSSTDSILSFLLEAPHTTLPHPVSLSLPHSKPGSFVEPLQVTVNSVPSTAWGPVDVPPNFSIRLHPSSRLEAEEPG